MYNKRNLPKMLQKILSADEYLTSQCTKFAEKYEVFKQLKKHGRLLEITCHGLLWIPCWIAFIWVINSKNLYQMQVNLLLGLLVDIIIVAFLKAYTRRRRPSENDDPFGFGPDKFSFPSGHAARCLFLVTFLINVWGVHFVFIPPLLSWSVCLCASRVLMRRHHILDVVAGAILGVLEAYFIQLIYLDEDTCTSLIYWITDEKLEGGEYHV